jgi:hypothetical protein
MSTPADRFATRRLPGADDHAADAARAFAASLSLPRRLEAWVIEGPRGPNVFAAPARCNIANAIVAGRAYLVATFPRALSPASGETA